MDNEIKEYCKYCRFYGVLGCKSTLICKDGNRFLNPMRNLSDEEAEIYDNWLNAEAADVQPVRHGRWVKCGKLEGKIVMKCSECEQGITAMFEPKYHYCPNCGARMDGDTNG